MQVENNFSLKAFNTFGIDVKAKWFGRFTSKEDLMELMPLVENDMLVLGGGSNVLFTGDYNGLVLKNDIGGIHTIHEDAEYVYIKAGAGVNWHAFVTHCIEFGLGGVENLSLIPGSVGASPMQNIGAYGVELKDVFHELDALNIAERTVVNFSVNDCRFGYRESVFKKEYKGQFIILSVTFRLRKNPCFNIEYGAIEQELERMKVTELTVEAISNAVINIRRSKLPNPAIIGNAGSFFKNPEVPAKVYLQLQEKFPTIVGYTLENGRVKLAAGWLIESCGWKGFRKGDAGCHKDQALVLVNYGAATGMEILDLSNEIGESVSGKFGIHLEKEVNIA